MVCAVAASGVLPAVTVTTPIGAIPATVGVPVGGLLGTRVRYPLGGLVYNGIDNLGLAYQDGLLGYRSLGLGYGRLGFGYGNLGLGYGGLGYLLRRWKCHPISIFKWWVYMKLFL